MNKIEIKAVETKKLELIIKKTKRMDHNGLHLIERDQEKWD